MSARPELSLSAEDHDRAFTEVCFLLDLFVQAIGDVVSKSGPALGIAAGRHMARKLPVHIPEPTMGKALEAIAARLAAGFEFSVRCDGHAAEVAVGRCAVRDVCARRGIPPGADLCRIFHYYIAGMASELGGVGAVKATDAAIGERCVFRLEAR